MTATTEATGRLTHIAPEDLRPHPQNRKRFDQAKLRDLADSIAKVGVLTPLLVRPSPDPKSPYYQILAGERRCRAAILAKAETVPCIVRDLTDIEALEILLVENLQREEVHALEEAQGYAELIKTHRLNVETIAAKVGKSTKYVYDRMKLLQLTAPLQQLFLDNEFTPGHAILLARLSKDDQARCLGDADDDYSEGGLFQPERADNWFPGMDEDEEEGLKPVSVRELESWIDKHVRFDTQKIDSFLLPDTAQAVQAATEEKEKVVQITWEHFIRPEARDDKTRTYGPQSWKRADGKEDSKACEHAVTGVVVVGPQRGEAFKVCIDKKKCAVHWKQEQAESKRRAKLQAKADTGDTSAVDKWERERQRQEAQRQKAEVERRRWLKAKPKLIEAAVARLKKAAAGPGSLVADAAMAEVRDYGETSKQLDSLLGKPKTAEDLLRQMALVSVLRVLRHEWRIEENAPKKLGALGIDARKIVDEVSPKETVQTAAAPSAKRPVKKRAAKT